MTTLEFYTERADDCRKQASSSTLANVRDRCLNAAAAWEVMADRLRRTEAFKADNEARRAADARPVEIS